VGVRKRVFKRQRRRESRGKPLISRFFEDLTGEFDYLGLAARFLTSWGARKNHIIQLVTTN